MNRYYIYILIAASLWGSIGIIVKLFYAAGFSPLQLVCFRTIIGSALIFLYLLVRDREKFKIRLKDLWLFFGTGILSFVFFNVNYFIAVEKTGLSVASVLLYTAPAFVFLLSVLIFKEVITRRKMGALALALLGCVLVSGVLQSSDVPLNGAGILSGILAGFGYGLYSIFAKLALTKYDTLTVTLYTFIFASLGAIPFARIEQVPGLITSGGLAVNIILFAVVITILPFTLYTKGLSRVEPSRASILATIEPVVATIFGVILFNEQLTMMKTIGIAAVIGAAILINVTPKSLAGGTNE